MFANFEITSGALRSVAEVGFGFDADSLSRLRAPATTGESFALCGWKRERQK